MAGHPDGAYLTHRGSAAIGNVLAAAGPLVFTRATVGDGFVPAGTAPEQMEGLAHYVMDAMIASVASPAEGRAEVVLQIDSAGVAAAFAASEIVLWAEDPVAGEVAYTYYSLNERPEWVRSSGDAVGKIFTVTCVADVSVVQQVKAAIDPRAFVRNSQLGVPGGVATLDPATGKHPMGQTDMEALNGELSFVPLVQEENGVRVLRGVCGRYINGTGIVKVTCPDTIKSKGNAIKMAGYSLGPIGPWELLLNAGAVQDKWSYCGALLTAGSRFFPRARFGYDGEKLCILLGEAGTVWLRQFISLESTVGETGTGREGWDMTLIPDASGVTNIAEAAVAWADPGLTDRLSSLRMQRFEIPANGIFKFAYNGDGYAVVATRSTLAVGRSYHIVYPGNYQNTGQDIQINTLVSGSSVALTKSHEGAPNYHVVTIANTVQLSGTYLPVELNIITTGYAVVVI